MGPEVQLPVQKGVGMSGPSASGIDDPPVDGLVDRIENITFPYDTDAPGNSIVSILI